MAGMIMMAEWAVSAIRQYIQRGDYKPLTNAWLKCSHGRRTSINYNTKVRLFKGANTVSTILLVILILLLIGAIPSWSHSKNWGYGPSGGIGLIVVILIILLLTGHI